MSITRATEVTKLPNIAVDGKKDVVVGTNLNDRHISTIKEKLDSDLTELFQHPHSIKIDNKVTRGKS